MNLLSKVVWISYFIFMTFSMHAYSQNARLPTIGIVGSGIGGASAAYFLRELFGKSADIDIYEKSEIGGRLATVEIGGKYYESGGSIIHPGNTYMVNFTRLVGLYQDTVSVGRIGLYNGRDMVFDGSEWKLVTVAQLMWRYGWTMVKLNNHIQNLMSKFDRIYKHQREGLSYSSPERLLESMDVKMMTYLHYSLEEVLSHDEFSQQFIDELAMGAMRNNYGQTQRSQAFVGSVALAGAEDGLWCVRGGNKQVPHKLLERTKVNIIRSKVNKISVRSSEDLTQYEVESDGHTNNYDIVVVAAPLHDGLADISFDGFEDQIKDFPENYHQTVATFVRGLPNFTKFGYKTLHQLPDFILPTDEKLFWNSMGKLRPVHSYASTYKDKQELPVWKVFSGRPLTEEQITELFMSHEEVKVVDWKAAYPHYSSSQVNLPSFKLAPQLYYVNAIELAASAMEMSAIGGRNVALLAYNEWQGHNDKVDPHVHAQFGRQEL